MNLNEIAEVKMIFKLQSLMIFTFSHPYILQKYLYVHKYYIYIYILFSYIHINLEKILKEKRDSTMCSSIKLRLAILQLHCWSTSLFFFL